MQIFENCIQSSVHQCMYKNAMNPKTSIPSNNAWCDRRSKSKQFTSGLSNYSKEVQLSGSFCKPVRSMTLSRGLTFKS